MLPYIIIGSLRIPTYGICVALGVLAAVFIAYRSTRAAGMNTDQFFSLVIYALVSGFIVAKLSYLLTVLPGLRLSFFSSFKNIVYLLTSGFMFYGGLIGGIIGAVLCARKYKFSLLPYFNIIVPVIPLGHAIGRLGCFLSGCCYGIPYGPPLGIAFQHPIGGAPANIPLFPVQLFESGATFLIFLFLIIATRKPRQPFFALGWYLTLYAIVRYILEKFRADDIRGIWFGLSTSQYISILLFAAGIILLLYPKIKKLYRKTPEN